MTDQQYMRRALELAQLGLGKTSPNPMVGCVIVYENVIIGEGYHQLYGGPHAEVNAISDVAQRELLTDSDVYVTLEPCSHYGKTPPCADLLIEHQVRKVIICNEDPNPLVSGNGIRKLKDAGIEVEVGLLADEGSLLNKRFFASFLKSRPYVILKWAQTADGFVARENFDSKWISNQYSRQLVHKWRSEEDAILVGKNTAKYDNPSLTTREWEGKNPVRVVLDKNLELSGDLQLFDGKTRTYVFSNLSHPERVNVTFIQLDHVVPEMVLAELHKERIQSIIVEGGSKTLQSFIDANLWDEARIFTAPATFDKGIPAPVLNGELIHEEDVLQDQLQIYINQNG